MIPLIKEVKKVVKRKKIKKFRGIVGSVSIVAFLFLCSLTLHAEEPTVQPVDDSISKYAIVLNNLLESLQPMSHKDTEQSQGPKELPLFLTSEDGYLSHLCAPPKYHFPVSIVVPGKPKETAYNFIMDNSKLLGITSPAIDFRVLKIKSENNYSYIWFEETYADLQVFGAQIIIKLNENGGVEYISSGIVRNTKALDENSVSLIPMISETDAVKRTLNYIIKEFQCDSCTKKYLNSGFKTTQPVLKIFDSSVFSDFSNNIRTVWDIKACSDKTPLINEQILLDAQTGEIVRHYSLNRYALNRRVYDAENHEDGRIGNLACTENDPPDSNDHQEVHNVFDYLGDTYRFYNTHHGRDSFDNDGTEINASVRWCDPDDPDDPNDFFQCPLDNAMWLSTDRARFGDGWAVDDLVGHEYTHGVTNNESELIYENQPGAISESFSDIWGEFIDQTNGKGDDSSNKKWRIGEDLPNGAIRDMKNPKEFGHPNRMGSDFFVPFEPNPNRTNDWGGVHTNCGVGNKLAFLLTDGTDNFRGYKIEGRGISRVVDLYYHVQCNLLRSNSDYRDLGFALLYATYDLGWDDWERLNLIWAIMSVEIFEDGESIVFVDWRNQNLPETGSSLYPFDTVTEGYNTVNQNGILIIHSGTYDETITFSKRMTLFSVYGSAIIG